jgi:hypothetical protein
MDQFIARFGASRQADGIYDSDRSQSLSRGRGLAKGDFCIAHYCRGWLISLGGPASRRRNSFPHPQAWCSSHPARGIVR